MHIDAYCNTEATTSLIRQHIPAASLIQENDEQLVYTLPLRDMDKFAGIDVLVCAAGWSGCSREVLQVRLAPAIPVKLLLLHLCGFIRIYHLADGQSARSFSGD